MTVPKIRSSIHKLQNFNFTTLISNFTSSSLVPFQKCCESDQSYSWNERKCVFSDFTVDTPNSDLYPDPSIFDIHYGFPCLYADYRYSESNSSEIQDFFHDASMNLYLNNEKMLYHLERGQYCFDMESGTSKFNPVLVTCDQLLPARSTHMGYLVLYLTSLLLVFINFSLHLGISELRAKVKDKCFICYLASLMFWMIIYADVWGINGISLLMKIVSVNVAFVLEWYSFMITYSWLNVMCIHLWRSVTTVNSISPRSFYIYALYAMGFPMLCRIIFEIDRSIFGFQKFSDRFMNGGLFSNPVLLYIVNVCFIQQIINVGIFIRVGYIFWDQKRRWSGNEDQDKIKRHCRHKTMFSQLLRLFIIMDAEWISIFIALYFGLKGIDNVFSRISFWVKPCPGYFIFIVHVCCNKQVTSRVRKRFSKYIYDSATVSHSSQHTLSLTLPTPNV